LVRECNVKITPSLIEAETSLFSPRIREGLFPEPCFQVTHVSDTQKAQKRSWTPDPQETIDLKSQKFVLFMSMRSKLRRQLRKIITTTSISKLHWAMVLFLLWLAYKLEIHERGGAVGVLVFLLVGLVIATLCRNYVRRRFRAGAPGPRRRL
jgi:hypothetical protein